MRIALLAALAASFCCGLAGAAETSGNPALSIRLTDYGKVEVKPSIFAKREAGMAEPAERVAGQIAEMANAKVARWHAEGVLRGNRTLIIQPEILALTLGGDGTMRRKSIFTLRLRLMDASNGATVGQTEFSGHADGADDEMLTKVVGAVSDYLDRSYQTALADVRHERELRVAKLEDAAKQGDPVAQSNLGNYFAIGLGVAQSDEVACTWWRKAADQGDMNAQLNLAWGYATGRGVLQDDEQAVRWWRKAAELGNAEAQLKLAGMYQIGRGVVQDNQEAETWYRKAAAHSHIH